MQVDTGSFVVVAANPQAALHRVSIKLTPVLTSTEPDAPLSTYLPRLGSLPTTWDGLRTLLETPLPNKIPLLPNTAVLFSTFTAASSHPYSTFQNLLGALSAGRTLTPRSSEISWSHRYFNFLNLVMVCPCCPRSACSIHVS